MREGLIQSKILTEISKSCPGFPVRLNAGRAWGGKRVWSAYHGCYVILDPKPIKLAPEGFSDIVYFGPGKDTVFIEVKNETGKTRKSQKRFLEHMKNMNFRCIVARSPEEAISFINGGPIPDD